MRERARILLVENDHDAAIWACHVLRKRGGFAVTHAASVADALQLATDGPWDLVLTEAELPGLSGAGLVAVLRRLAPTAPVAVMTAQDLPETTAAELRGLAVALLAKPVPIGRLVSTITSLIEKPGGGNPGVWRLLHGRTVRAARVIYLGIERTPLAPVLHARWVQRLKARVTHMPAECVLSVLDRVHTAGVTAWVAGGWGVDALAGRQTRRHYDLDLLIGDEPDQYARITDALAAGGFRLTETQRNPGLAMPVRHLWQHDRGYSVEVLPVVLGDPPFGTARPAFAQGTIAGRPVPCLSAALQLALHAGYPLRDIDATDIDLLQSLHALAAGRG